MEKRKWTTEEIEEWRKNSNSGLFHFNREDSNIFVPKRYGIGFTLNWANPLAWLTIVGIVAVIIVIKMGK